VTLKFADDLAATVRVVVVPEQAEGEEAEAEAAATAKEGRPDTEPEA
jgi:hypothetical protein